MLHRLYKCGYGVGIESMLHRLYKCTHIHFTSGYVVCACVPESVEVSGPVIVGLCVSGQ